MFSLILPTYNESGNIERCIRAVAEVLQGYDFEIVVADDNSPDLTWKIAEDLNLPFVKVVRRMTNRGLSPAVVEGFEKASGDMLGVMDADMQHDHNILPKMIEALKVHEFVIASRAVDGGSYGDFSLSRLVTSFAAAEFARQMLGIKLSDPMAGFFAIRREAFERAKPHLSPKGFKIMLELFCLCQPKSYTEVGCKFGLRHAGESKLSARVMGQYIASVFDLRKKMKAIAV